MTMEVLASGMNLRIDRELPVPLGTQLKGLIEYGIACGELAPGERLPSVRELATGLGLAPMTVSQVYKDLRTSGLIEGRAGSGTFVAAADPPPARTPRHLALEAGLDRVIQDARALGVAPGELQALLGARLLAAAGGDRRGSRLRLALVGLFPDATRRYADALRARLPDGDAVEPLTLEELGADAAARRRAATADLALTFAHLRARVAALLPGTLVRAVSFIPAERTRAALAALDPRARVCLVSTFGAFLPLMKAGVRRFAPHVAALDAGALDAPGLDALLPDRDTVVYATGAEAVLPRLGAEVRAIEYRHMPDPGEVDRTVLPLLERLRAGRSAPNDGEETSP